MAEEVNRQYTKEKIRMTNTHKKNIHIFSLLEGAVIMDYFYTQEKKIKCIKKWREPNRGSKGGVVSILLDMIPYHYLAMPSFLYPKDVALLDGFI